MNVTVQPGDLVLVLEQRTIREICSDDVHVFALAQIHAEQEEDQVDAAGQPLIRVSKAWSPAFRDGGITWDEGTLIWPLTLYQDGLYLLGHGEFFLLKARDMEHASALLMEIRRANTDHRTLINAENDRHARSITAIHERLEQRLLSLGS